MFWGMAFTILFIIAGSATGIKEFHGIAMIAFTLAGACASIAGLGCKIDQED